jgi:hypothetical protein
MRSKRKRLITPCWVWFGLTLAGIALFTRFGPAEHSLGTHVRIVYLHGAWVWTALAAFVSAGITGLVALLKRQPSWHCWSRALGYTGLFFWITYLPLSLWAMQANWNGLFLAEPRWRLALVFSISGLLMQTGFRLLGDLRWTSLGNLTFVGVLLFSLERTENVMHPVSPILTSDAWLIRLYYFTLLALTMLAAGQMARFFKRLTACSANR